MNGQEARQFQDRTTRHEHLCESTQIYEGTNQIQRVVMAKRLLS